LSIIINSGKDAAMKVAKQLNWAVMLAGVVMIGLLSGCETIGQQEQRALEMRRQEDMRLMREKNRRLAGEVERLDLEIQRLEQQLTGVRRDASDSAQSGVRSLEGRVRDLENAVSKLQADRIKDRDEIINTLSKKMAAVLKSSGGGSRKRSSKRRHSEYGYEHKVEPGQTLSEIAAAYGVSTRAIIEENDLKNPDRLIVGQKLFIPE